MFTNPIVYGYGGAGFNIVPPTPKDEDYRLAA